jgi:hypothetical protein
MRTYRSLLALVLVTSCASEVEVEPDREPPITTSFALRNDLRELWTEDAVLTRSVLIGLIEGHPDTDVASARLLEHQADIGDVLRPFYGDTRADEVTRLLREHALLAHEVVYAETEGGSEQAIDAWYTNADTLARYLAETSPAWSREELRTLFRIYIDQTIVEARARLNDEHGLEADTFGGRLVYARMIADTLAAGIAEQLPELVGGVGLSPLEQAIYVEQRELWEEHVIWTRFFIVESLEARTEHGTAALRLLAHDGEIGAAMAVFFGEEAGAQIARLLSEQAVITSDLVHSLVNDDGAGIQIALAAFSANAHELAAHLASLNAAWSEQELEAMWRTHHALTARQALARLAADWERDAAAYDAIQEHMRDGSDALSAGIVAQLR